MGDFEGLLTRLYEAFNRKDIEAVLVFAHPDVVWHSLFDNTWLRGQEAVRDMWLRQFATINPEMTLISFTPLEDGRARVLISYVIRSLDGKIFTEEVATNTYSFKDGLIIGMEWD